MGIYYEEIESNAVGFKEDYEMHSMDFEEFLWARGYSPEQIEDLYQHMKDLQPFSQLELDTMTDVFREYMSLGGMPEVVKIIPSYKDCQGGQESRIYRSRRVAERSWCRQRMLLSEQR